MAKSLKGARTEENLLKSFAGESQARNRYEFFAAWQGRKVMSRLPIFYMKNLFRKRSMQKGSSGFSREE